MEKPKAVENASSGNYVGVRGSSQYLFKGRLAFEAYGSEELVIRQDKCWREESDIQGRLYAQWSLRPFCRFKANSSRGNCE